MISFKLASKVLFHCRLCVCPCTRRVAWKGHTSGAAGGKSGTRQRQWQRGDRGGREETGVREIFGRLVSRFGN